VTGGFFAGKFPVMTKAISAFFPTLLATLLATLLSTLLARPLHAQGRYPDAYALRPLQLPPSLVQVKIPLVIDLSRGHAGKPIFVPLDLRVGVTDELELRLFHPVNGVCLRGCGKVYNDAAFGLLYSLLRENGFEASLLAAFEVRSFSSPAQVALDVGVDFKYVRAPFSIFVGPYLGLPITDREHQTAWINVPAEFAYQVSPATAVFLETGLYGDVHDSGNWSGPLGVGVNQLIQHGVDLGAEFKLNTMVGHTDTGSRLVLVYLAFRS
jgi:hypothetical protein